LAARRTESQAKPLLHDLRQLLGIYASGGQFGRAEPLKLRDRAAGPQFAAGAQLAAALPEQLPRSCLSDLDPVQPCVRECELPAALAFL
jgi:hypothetical protein